MQGTQENKTDIALKRSRFAHKELKPFVIGDSCCNKTLLLAREFVHEVLFPIQANKPEDCDLLIVHGVITPQLIPYIKEVSSQMKSPFVVMAVGQCTLSGAYFSTTPLSEVISVDVDVFGCAPDPRSLEEGIEKAREVLVQKLSQIEVGQ